MADAAQSKSWTAGKVGLVLRGEHFSAAGVEQAQALRQQLLQHLVDHIQGTQGYGVIVVDEAQKMHPAVLAALVPLMDSKGGHVSLPDGRGSIISLPVRKIIFVIVCDVGHQRMRSLLGAGASPSQLRAALRQELLRRWQGEGVAEVMHAVVPFMPFSPARVFRVLQLFVSRLQRRWALPLVGGGASPLQPPARLQVSTAASQHMTSMVRFAAAVPQSDTPSNSSAVVFAQFGARQVHEHEDGPVRRLEFLLHKHSNRLQDDALRLLKRAAGAQEWLANIVVDLAPAGQQHPAGLWDTEPTPATQWHSFLKQAVQQELLVKVCLDPPKAASVAADGHVGSDGASTERRCAEPAWRGRLSAA